LKSRCLGNAALLERVLQTFTVQLDADLKQLQQAFSTGDTSTCAQLSHRIKGMAANVEARSLSRHAASAEQFARASSLPELSEHLERMQQERGRLMDSLVAYSGSSTNSSQSLDEIVP
jgi:HPt (histidine-containing phosphotransfer) domain-containing protein